MWSLGGSSKPRRASGGRASRRCLRASRSCAVLWSQLLDPEVPSNPFFLSSPLMYQTARPRHRKLLHKPNPVCGAEKDEKRKTGKKGLTEGAASGSDSEVEALTEVCTGRDQRRRKGARVGWGQGLGPSVGSRASTALRSPALPTHALGLSSQ